MLFLLTSFIYFPCIFYIFLYIFNLIYILYINVYNSILFIFYLSDSSTVSPHQFQIAYQ